MYTLYTIMYTDSCLLWILHFVMSIPHYVICTDRCALYLPNFVICIFHHIICTYLITMYCVSSISLFRYVHTLICDVNSASFCVFFRCIMCTDLYAMYIYHYTLSILESLSNEYVLCIVNFVMSMCYCVIFA